MFCQCEGGETQNGRNSKRHQNWQVQKLFRAVEKMSQKVYDIKWRVLWRWLKFMHVGINIHFLINKFHLWGPLLYTNLQLRKLKFWKVCSFHFSSIPGTGHTNTLVLKMETGSCPWFLLSIPLNLWTVLWAPVTVRGHPDSKWESKGQKMVW